MEIDLSQLHFLRPFWLLPVIPALLLAWFWHRQQNSHKKMQHIIAPHLLKHLMVHPNKTKDPRPIWILTSLLCLASLAAAGPTWNLDQPPFLQDKAILIVAIDLSASMDGTDLSPTRLEAVKKKLRDLLAQRSGTKTALLVYTDHAHLVLPPTEDIALLESYIEVLSTQLLNRPGKNVLSVIQKAQTLLSVKKQEDSFHPSRMIRQELDDALPGSLLLITDGADTSQLKLVQQKLEQSKVPLQVLILSVGYNDGGVITDKRGSPRFDNNGKPLTMHFDAKALQKLANAADAPIGSLSLNNDDLDWIRLHVKQHFQRVQPKQENLHWKDQGYWLCWLLVPLILLSIRKGWNLRWISMIFCALSIGAIPQKAQANIFIDAFFSGDQQGRWYFEHQDWQKATAHFNDPYWKGLAAYQAAEFNLALKSFTKMANSNNTQQSTAYFYIGNSQARLLRYTEAIAAYRQALKIQPDFPEAEFNLALVRTLQEQLEAAQKFSESGDQPMQQSEDEASPGKGKNVVVEGKNGISTDVWLRNLDGSPAGFLRRKFRAQQEYQDALEHPR